jgi:hypothetical protein
MKSLLPFGLVALGALVVGSVRADDRPLKIDFTWRFDIKYGPSYMVPPNLPPWYLWFPNQPSPVMETAQKTPYPNWPTTWPPAGTSADGAPPAMRQVPRSQAPFGGDMSGSGFQPTGFAQPQQIPQYWYGR